MILRNEPGLEIEIKWRPPRIRGFLNPKPKPNRTQFVEWIGAERRRNPSVKPGSLEYRSVTAAVRWRWSQDCSAHLGRYPLARIGRPRSACIANPPSIEPSICRPPLPRLVEKPFARNPPWRTPLGTRLAADAWRCILYESFRRNVCSREPLGTCSFWLSR
jgi:hypothetical protein